MCKRKVRVDLFQDFTEGLREEMYVLVGKVVLSSCPVAHSPVPPLNILNSSQKIVTDRHSHTQLRIAHQ